MPTFDYSCPKCKEVKIDEIVKSSLEIVTCDCGAIMDRALCAPRLMGFDKYGTSKKSNK